MITKFQLLFTAILLTTFLSNSQNISVIMEGKIELDLDDMILVENHLAINPSNENHWLLSGMYVNSKDSNEYGNFAVVSFDKGTTWTNLNFFNIPEGADPWGVITKKGNALTTVLGLENLYVQVC